MKVARRKLASHEEISLCVEEEVEAIAVVLLATVLLPLYENVKQETILLCIKSITQIFVN